MSLTPRIDKIERELNAGRVKTSLIEAPNTQIKNEQGDARKITDLSNNLKASFGIERVDITGWTLLNKEFGPSGEPVYGPSSDDERFRFVGPLTSTNSSSGVRHFLNSSNFVEVTFYGTALNMLNGQPADGTRTIEYSVDGGASQTVNMSASNILEGRNYTTRCVFNVVSGLSLGVHTVKISLQSGSTPVYFSGFEIVNTTSQLAVNTGSPIIGTELSVQQLLDVKPAELTSAKGGRVITYLDEDGTIGRAVTAVDPRITEGDPTELVTNGDFSTGDLTGWTTDLGSPAGTIVVNGSNQVSMTLGGSFGTRAQLYQTLTTVIGEKYTVNFDIINISGPSGGTGAVEIFTDATRSTSITQTSYSIGTTGSQSIAFTATTTTSTIQFQPSIQFNTNFTADNISVKEVAYNFLALSDTDHSQEEIVREVNFREFGANRGDDFSSLAGSASDRAFTLDDGTTTLVGDNVIASNERLFANSNTNFFTVTFVGTGLDVIGDMNASEITIDGTLVGKNVDSNGDIIKAKICSGLPYGTHTVKFQRVDGNGAGADGVSDFIIYQPKKPELPATALQEIADYNVMADYSHNTTEGDINQISQGVLRKQSSREFVYLGAAWSSTLGVFPTSAGGNRAITTNNDDTAQYTFFGTGIVFQSNLNASGDFETILDGLILTAANYPSATVNTSSSLVYNSSTGRTTNTSSVTNATIAITGLPLGVHKIQFAKKGGTNFQIHNLDIITPIHINTNLKTGSLALKDLRKEDTIQDLNVNKIDLTKAKAWVVYDFSTQEIAASYNVAAVLQQTAQNAKLYFKQPFKHTPSALMMGNGVGGTLTYMIRGINGVGSPDRHGLDFRPDNINNVTYVTVVCFGELENEEDIDLEDL